MELFPLDILVMLMLHVNEFTTLWNLIRSCHSVYDAFSAARRSILSSVLRNAVDPGLLAIAMALHHVPARNSSHSISIEDYMEQWASPLQYPLPDTELFNHLARRHKITEVHTQRMCGLLAKSFFGEGPAETFYNRLSSTEIKHIQRGFYRFDFFAAFHAYSTRLHMERFPQTVPLPGVSSETLLWHLNNVAPWENEEMLTVSSYLWTLLSQVMKDVSTVVWNGEPNESHRAVNHLLRNQNNREVLASFGSKAIFEFVDSSLAQQRERLRSCLPVSKSFHLVCFMSSLSDMISLPTSDHVAEWKTRGAEKQALGPSFGWEWFYNQKSSAARRQDRLDQDQVYERGLLLWNRERAERLVDLEKPYKEFEAWDDRVFRMPLWKDEM